MKTNLSQETCRSTKMPKFTIQSGGATISNYRIMVRRDLEIQVHFIS